MALFKVVAIVARANGLRVRQVWVIDALNKDHASALVARRWGSIETNRVRAVEPIESPFLASEGSEG